MHRFDRIVLGAGLYGVYAALRCAGNGERVLVLERDAEVFSRATYINQARLHMGYHYPRSLSTAVKSAGYYERFVRDYGFCVMGEFEQVYATSARYSWTDAGEFERFCRAAGIHCDAVPPSRYFREGMCDGAFLTTEATYDAMVLRDKLMDDVSRERGIEVRFCSPPERIERSTGEWVVRANGEDFITQKILNATYAGVNNVHAMVGVDFFPIKYELCEIILCEATGKLPGVGLTVMDGPFFSIMPFGRTGLYSLTSVTFTPHMTSHDGQPTFSCQSNASCRCEELANCNTCPARPASSWSYMSQLARKYLLPEYSFTYRKSLFSMKPILKSSEVDDSRPTVIRRVCKDPEMLSVLSGKINTVYDLDPYLDGLE